ncbi:ABC transporter permease [Inmirania thermothiophila]|uniref:Transport permease protein n=1 Tax=Inmirania thermothiophila TaxID=1750597 RepID=A0A3N1Y705_9GAMM|nr:ABC transporter permease [Inmirania thermothiophila]ROR34596.1 lipooligosaccharide transport system permease protein [Inmirania thermothiophila]
MDWGLPRPGRGALAVWRRNLLVWRKLMGASLTINFGEPFLYLLGLGYGLGFFIGDMAGMPYLTFLATGVVAASAMQTATFEGMYSVFTRMVPQRTYEAMLAAPLTVDDILAGELLWCASKGLLSGVAILVVAAALGAVGGWGALWVIPVVFVVGLCFAGPALVMSALSPNYDFFVYYQTLGLTPMFILCGVFYPVDTLPPAVQTAVQVLPLTHAVALVRPLVAGLAVDDVGLHLAVLLAYAAAGYYLAVVLVRRRLLV